MKTKKAVSEGAREFSLVREAIELIVKWLLKHVTNNRFRAVETTILHQTSWQGSSYHLERIKKMIAFRYSISLMAKAQNFCFNFFLFFFHTLVIWPLPTRLIFWPKNSNRFSNRICWFGRQAMYATVQDAAIVIAKATETFLTSKDGKRILQSYRVSGGCPLRSMKEGETALGQRMLNEIKMVILII